MEGSTQVFMAIFKTHHKVNLENSHRHRDFVIPVSMETGNLVEVIDLFARSSLAVVPFGNGGRLTQSGLLSLKSQTF